MMWIDQGVFVAQKKRRQFWHNLDKSSKTENWNAIKVLKFCPRDSSSICHSGRSFLRQHWGSRCFPSSAGRLTLMRLRDGYCSNERTLCMKYLIIVPCLCRSYTNVSSRGPRDVASIETEQCVLATGHDSHSSWNITDLVGFVAGSLL